MAEVTLACQWCLRREQRRRPYQRPIRPGKRPSGQRPDATDLRCSDHNLTDRGKFQDFVDQVAMAAPVTKYARLVDRPEKIPFYIHEALAHSVAGTPGPVHLTIPEDVLDADVSNDLITPISAATNAIVEQRCVGDSRLIRSAGNSRRPLMVPAMVLATARSLAELLRQISVVVPIWDGDPFPIPFLNSWGLSAQHDQISGMPTWS